MPHKRALQTASVVVAVLLLGTLAWTAAAVHTIAPRSGPGDVFGAGTLAGKIASNQRINLLFLARGGAGHDNPDFTDTILVLSVRPASHAATVISLPRYLWVAVPAPVSGVIDTKIYSAYALAASDDPTFLHSRWRTPTGQGDLTAVTVSATIGQPIDGWISVDIKGFAALIDAIGGIRINVPETLDDPTYPSDSSDKTIHIHFDAGPQTLDGRRALEYARSRMSTTERDRSRRQEIVLFAMLKGLRNAGIGPALIPAAPALKDGLLTNLTLSDARSVMQLVSGLAERDLKSILLDDSPLLAKRELEGNQDVLVPRSGTYQEIQSYIAEELP